MLPPVPFVWDEYIIPKRMAWAGVLLCATASVLKNGAPSRGTVIHGTANAIITGIVLQALFVCIELLHNHHKVLHFGACGAFDNPAGLSFHICFMLSLAIVVYNKVVALQRHALLLLCVGVAVPCLCLTLSRTGLIASLLMIAYLLLKRTSSRTIRIGACVAMIIAMVACTLVYKQGSTSGRAFILARSLELVARHPFVGYGTGGFEREYMLEQSRYFHIHPDDSHVMLADEVRHPLNEFVFFWIEYGIIAPLMLCACLAYCRFKVLSLCMLPFLLFSYPLCYPLAWCALLGNTALRIVSDESFVFNTLIKKAVTVALCFAFIVWCYILSLDIRMSMANKSALAHAHSHAARKYAALETEMKAIPPLFMHHKRISSYLYNYTYELFQTRRFDEALNMYAEGCKHFNSYDYELLAGDILYQKAKACPASQDVIQQSSSHYQKAYDMCPVRFAPLVGLLHLYSLDPQHKAQADSIARIILDKPVKVPSSTIGLFKQEANQQLSAKHK